MRGKGPVLALAALIAVLALAGIGYNVLGSRSNDTPSEQQPQQDEQTHQDDSGAAEAPAGPLLADYDARIYDADGNAVQLSEIAAGKPLVINFWATWCPYCIEEMPDFQQIYREYGDRVAFAFIDATDGQRETAAVAAAWLVDNGFDDLPAYYDSDYNAITSLGVRAFPTTVVVAADGQIVGFASGMIDPVLMRQALDELL